MPTSSEALVMWLMAGRDDHDPPGIESFLRRPAWMAKAAYKGEPVGTFFPERGGSLERARELRAACPVRPECLSYALEEPDLQGVWGGTSQRGRRGMRRSVA